MPLHLLKGQHEKTHWLGIDSGQREMDTKKRVG